MPDKTIKEQIAEFFAEMFGKKPEAVGFSEAQVTDIVAKAVTAATAPLIAANTALTTQFNELSTRLQASNVDARKAKAITFVEKMKAAGKWLPAWDRAGVPALLEKLAVSAETVKFGEAGKEVEMSLFDQQCAFYESHANMVPTQQIAGQHKTPAGKLIQFNESRGVALDMQSLALNDRAEAIAKEQKISFAEALPLAIQELSA